MLAKLAMIVIFFSLNPHVNNGFHFKFCVEHMQVQWTRCWFFFLFSACVHKNWVARFVVMFMLNVLFIKVSNCTVASHRPHLHRTKWAQSVCRAKDRDLHYFMYFYVFLLRIRKLRLGWARQSFRVICNRLLLLVNIKNNPLSNGSYL